MRSVLLSSQFHQHVLSFVLLLPFLFTLIYDYPSDIDKKESQNLVFISMIAKEVKPSFKFFLCHFFFSLNLYFFSFFCFQYIPAAFPLPLLCTPTTFRPDPLLL